jgi:phosphoribosylanthranilate isomerase
MKVLISGITSVPEARLVASAGADLLGMVFHERDARAIMPELARTISRELRRAYRDSVPLLVGTFVDERVAVVRELISYSGLDLVLLGGSEPPVEVRLLRPYAFKAIRPQTRGDAEAIVATYAHVLEPTPDTPDFLVDSYSPWGFGATVPGDEWAIPQVIARRFRILLRGGLTLGNLAAAIEKVQPWGVATELGEKQQAAMSVEEYVTAFIRSARAPGAVGDDFYIATEQQR